MNAPVPININKAREKLRVVKSAGRRGGPGGPGGGATGGSGSGEPSSLPVIQVVASEMPRVVDEAEEALIDGGVPVFSRAGQLVHPVVEAVQSAAGRPTRVARLRALCADALTDLLAQHAKFQRWNEQREAWVNVDPPAKVAATMLVREGRWRLRPVSGIVHTPTLRPDGTLLDEPGYDPSTRLYVMLDEAFVLPEIPARPTRAEALAARDLLADLLREFPFVGATDRAVALSMILTAIVRPTLPVAPLHAIRASTAGTGKSYLVDVAATIATGRPCAVMAVGKTEEETNKRLDALLLDGAPLISLDNVNGELGGDTLCQMTERTAVRVRILGRSEMPEVECRSAIFATGNNLVLVGDMTRRAVLCSLDAGVEQPEFRRFEDDPIARALADRGAYVAAALTIVRAFRLSGEAPCPPIGSYGAWSDRVRSALVWLGEADPVASLAVARSEDPARQDLAELVAAWREHLEPDAWYATSDLEERARETGMMGEHTHASLREILLRKCGKGPLISTRSLGRWLTGIRGRVVNGHRIEMVADEKKGNRYALRRVLLPREGET